MTTRLRIGVIYGGRSGEHEVSVVSAASICRHLDRAKYEPVPICIEKSGRWLLAPDPPTANSTAEVTAASALVSHEPVEPSAVVTRLRLDVVFPVLHGPYGEDGTVQGLLELANVAYVGAGVLGSAVGMDKAVMKVLFAAVGLPIVPHVTVLSHDWRRDSPGVTARIARALTYPVFVKPANLGSSVGISKVRSEDALAAAIDLALQFDRKIVVETGVPNAREIECAVLGNDEPEASVPGEVVPSGEFYDYRAKYLDEGSRLLIPAPLTPAEVAEVRRLSLQAFSAVDGAGMCRVDFLMARETGTLYLNEVNTIPGFTAGSMYPKMWEASGVPSSDLIDRLIALAIERHLEKQRIHTSHA